MWMRDKGWRGGVDLIIFAAFKEDAVGVTGKLQVMR